MSAPTAIETPPASEWPAVMRGASGNDAFWSMGNRFTVRLSSVESAGALTMLEVVAPAGAGPPLHVHHREAEVFYVLEGRMTYRAGDQSYELGPGSSIYLPRDVPHAFRVTGDAPARFLALTTPGGIEALYEQLRRLPDGDGLPAGPSAEEIGRWTQTAPAFGLQMCGPPLPAS